ncbi:Retrovirus-related Pol polyprotein from transposon TNT 1-94 [Sesbania bispinosa]|nr:Retrovirus-related Pol polyprotein from transposon TNT 1-94 [Sesbania bispinosa]
MNGRIIVTETARIQVKIGDPSDLSSDDEEPMELHATESDQRRPQRSRQLPQALRDFEVYTDQ